MSLLQGQSKALLLATTAVESCLPELVDLAWREYAAPRWKEGSALSKNMRLQFDAEVSGGHERMRLKAWRGRKELKFSRLRLAFFALKSLDHVCPFCEELYGVESMGIEFDVDPGEAWYQGDPFAILNVVVCCDVCSLAKGELTGDEFLNVSAALAMLDDDKAKRYRRRLALVGNSNAEPRERKGTSRGPGG